LGIFPYFFPVSPILPDFGRALKIVHFNFIIFDFNSLDNLEVDNKITTLCEIAQMVGYFLLIFPNFTCFLMGSLASTPSILLFSTLVALKTYMNTLKSRVYAKYI